MPTLDPTTQFWLNVLLGSLSLLVTVLTLLLALIGWPRRILTFELTSENRIIDPKAKYNSKLQILFDGKEEPDAHLLMLEFTNLGNRPLTIEDYDEEVAPGIKGLRIQLTNPASRILTANIVTPNRISTRNQVQIIENPSGTTFACVPAVPLNPHESFVIECILSAESHGIDSVLGHITGFNVRSAQPIYLYIFGFLVPILAILYATWVSFIHHPQPVAPDQYLATILMVLAATFQAWALRRLPRGALRKWWRHLSTKSPVTATYLAAVNKTTQIELKSDALHSNTILTQAHDKQLADSPQNPPSS
jgi:hypothetical protein